MQSLRPVLSSHPKNPFLPIRPTSPKLTLPISVKTSYPCCKFPKKLFIRHTRVEACYGKDNAPLKNTDVVTLGNLCVDIVLNVPSLPPPSREDRQRYFDRLSASHPDKKFWEAGGNSNLSIAAARLGLQCSVMGHIGSEIYGIFLLKVLQEEGIRVVEISDDPGSAGKGSSSYQTLLCWVLVDPLQRHGFCSSADFSKEPAFSWIKQLSRPVMTAIQQSKIFFCNGYVFDELHTEVIIAALNCAIDAQTTVFFDPGPKGGSLSTGSPEERKTLELFLKSSDVLLMTSDEAEELTGLSNPILAGRLLISQGTRTQWVIIKIGSKGSVLLTESSIFCAPAFQVDVLDTVGCGDSFTAAIAFGYLQKMPKIEMLALANAVGAATATGCGAGRNVAGKDKVLEILRISDVNEDYPFWNHLLDAVSDEKVVLLSKSEACFQNESKNKVSFVSVGSATSKIILQLEEQCAFPKVSS